MDMTPTLLHQPFLFRMAIALLLTATAVAAPTPASTEMVAMRDGVHLATDIYLPSSGTGPWPAVLQRTPYGRSELASHSTSRTNFAMAFIAQDLRGRDDSEGEDLVFRTDGWGELQDGYDTLEWVASQEWCNGSVMMEGFSGLGIAALYAAGTTPPWLTSVQATMAGGDLYFDNVYSGGILRRRLISNWLEMQDNLDYIDVLVAHPLLDDWWDCTRLPTQWDSFQVPLLQVAGWFDIYVDSSIEAATILDTAGSGEALGNQIIIIGPWTHQRVGLAQQGELTFPASAEWGLWQNQLVAGFTSQTLQGIDYHIFDEPTFQYYSIGDVDDPTAPGNTWHESDVWPPAGSEATLFFHSGGLLSTAPPVGDSSPSTEYVCDPSDPIPTIGGRNLYPPSGPYDQASNEVRADMLTFTTTPVITSLEIAGPVDCCLYVSSTAVDADYMIKLCDVYPDGRSMLMMEGALHARSRGGFDHEEFMTPGEVYELNIRVGQIALTLAQGHRLRISVASNNDERFEVNPQTGAPLMLDDPTTVVATHTIHHSPAYPSHITIPVTVDSPPIGMSVGLVTH